ncbi:MAG: acyl-CoA dehydrogenase [Acidimicrobiales bacterium]|nr:acyl-CoA dehydrogenase [Acidimicrobiales bacterium]
MSIAAADVALASMSDDDFRRHVQQWLAEHVIGDYASLTGRGGPGDEEVGFDIRVAWEQELGRAGWIGIGWPVEFGGRGASVAQQIIWAEEYTRAQAPARANHMGENLLAPTLIEYGTREQCDRFLPGILDGTVRWCQGYSEPDAGSDLANVKTRGVLDGSVEGGGEWVINGQKVWTSLAHVSHWCFVVARTEAGTTRHKGLSFLLVPMDQPGVETRIIRQITGGGEFNETFFTDARTPADMIIGAPGAGWGVAMGLLGFERGISTLAQQVGFERELQTTIDIARHHGRANDPVVRQRLVKAHTGLQLMRWNALRSMGAGVPGPEASIGKLFWGTWHRDLGELMIDLQGAAGLAHEPVIDPLCPDDDLTLEQKLFLFTRSDTIYGGSNEIQRNVLGERVLGLPKEPQAKQPQPKEPAAT